MLDDNKAKEFTNGFSFFKDEYDFTVYPYNRVFYVSVGILYNCARNMELRQKFRELSLVNLLISMLDRKENIVKLLTLLTLCYIIDEKDNHLLLADNTDFDFLLDMISEAWSSPDGRYWDSLQMNEKIYFSLEELLRGLGNLARNDMNKKVLMNKG
nr:hypothetical protein BaRGS_026741 [Batillaria attramentaria]